MLGLASGLILNFNSNSSLILDRVYAKEFFCSDFLNSNLSVEELWQLPLNISFIPHHGTDFGPLQTMLPKYILQPGVLRMFQKLELESLSNTGFPFVEVGAMVFVFNDGSSDVIYFTSNHPTQIGIEQIESFNESKVPSYIKSGKWIVKTFHVHTHPAPEHQHGYVNKHPFINHLDQSAYLNWIKRLNKAQGRPIEEFQGWVIVVGQNYRHLFISTVVNF